MNEKSAVFSPSQTATWARCPMMRALRAEGWVSKYAKKKDLAAIVGTCVAAGLGVYNNLRKEHEQQGTALDRKAASLAAMGSAFSVLEQQMEELRNSGRIIDVEDLYVEQMRDRIGKGVTTYIAKEPIPPTWRIIDVERPFPDHGNARPDLVVRDDLGLAIVDWKSKVQLKEYYRNKTIQEYANSHQMYHYAWAGQEVYGESIGRYYIGLIVLEPFSVELVPFPIHQEQLLMWEQSARQIWHYMAKEDRGESLPYMSPTHQDQFGPCEYTDACFKYRLDADLMRQGYINLKEQ